MIVPLNSVDLARDNCAFDVDANRTSAGSHSADRNASPAVAIDPGASAADGGHASSTSA